MDYGSATVFLFAVLAFALVGLGIGMALLAWMPARPVPAPEHKRSPSPAPLEPNKSDHRITRRLAEEFFRDKRCACCGLAIAEQPLINHPAALRAPDGVTLEWSRLSVEQLRAAFETHEPICWNCHVAEEFRRLYPQLVVDRPEHAPVIH